MILRRRRRAPFGPLLLLLASFLIVATLVVSGAAVAAPHAVVVVQGSSANPVVARLVPELLAAGYTVRTESGLTEDVWTDGDAFVRSDTEDAGKNFVTDENIG